MINESVLSVLALFFSGAALIACGSGPKADAYGESNAARVSGDSVVVEMKDLQFGPQGIRVRPGTTVTWVNNDPVVHNVRQVQSAFLSPEEMPEGATVTVRRSRRRAQLVYPEGLAFYDILRTRLHWAGHPPYDSGA